MVDMAPGADDAVCFVFLIRQQGVRIAWALEWPSLLNTSSLRLGLDLLVRVVILSWSYTCYSMAMALFGY